jgi:Putative MetA-pathway of phenol degradation
MTRYIFTIGLFLGSSTQDLLAQVQSPIQLDRPDQTECPFITPKNYIQIENGFTFEKTKAGKTALSIPTSLWKYGINDKLEIRVVTEITTEKTNSGLFTGISPITFGFKTALFEENGILPKTSFIGHLTSSNIGSKEYRTSHIAPSFRFTMQHTVIKRVSLAYNIGAEWNGETPEQNYIYTLTTGITLSEKLGYYAELYGFLAKSQAPDNRCDTGFTYLLNTDLMIDVSLGLGFKASNLKNYASLGVSYRFNVRK